MSRSWFFSFAGRLPHLQAWLRILVRVSPATEFEICFGTAKGGAQLERLPAQFQFMQWPQRAHRQTRSIDLLHADI